MNKSKFAGWLAGLGVLVWVAMVWAVAFSGGSSGAVMAQISIIPTPTFTPSPTPQPPVIDPGLTLIDIHPGPGISYAEDLTNVNGTLFLRATDGSTGRELWKSDGTQTGTVLVKDIDPGPDSSYPGDLTNVNGTLFFSADDGSTGYELWKSDGTEDGTVLVKDIDAGPGNSSPEDLTNVNGTLFFSARDRSTGHGLWKSDGTQAGTVLVKDIDADIDGTSFSYSLSHLTNVNGTLFFVANSGSIGRELWKSDGTQAGTVLVKDINPGPDSSYLRDLTNVNGTLFFRADDGSTGHELWKSDGTQAGTVLVKDINPGLGDSYPADLTSMEGTLFFSARDGLSARELWRSDGTQDGTALVARISPGRPGGSSPRDLANVNGTLFFGADDGSTGAELWKSDGTQAGTVLVKDINPGPGGSFPSEISSLTGELTNVNGTLFLGVDDGSTGLEPWKSDGTQAGTVLVMEINTSSGGSYPSDFTGASGTVFFTASDFSTAGRELWALSIEQPNLPPTAEAGGPYTVGEGNSISLDGSGSFDPDAGDTLTYEWDLDYDGAAFDIDATGQTPSFDASNLDGPDARTVALRVTDSAGASGIDTAAVTIENVAPAVEEIIAPVEPVQVGIAFIATATFTEPHVFDTHTATWYWGDGSTSPGIVNEANGSGSVMGTHAYTAPGVYAIRLAVLDDGGYLGEFVFEYVVVYGSDGGYVTGGGWIWSPAGAYVPDPSLVGKATFGFVSKYKKGASVPTGNTNFQFKAGDLHFESSSYDWLVIAGQDKAKYKGVGTVNGGGNYGFMLTAVDGSPDTFRIKIWDKDAGDLVIYDNKMDADDDSYDGTALGGGNIRVHKD